VTPLESAHIFMKALEGKDPGQAAGVCADGVVIELPGTDNELHGKDGARQLVRMAPPFIRTVREENEMGTTAVLKGLTRAPGQFANYTTWTFETEDGLITRVTFSWKPAN
jgi:hypothetical protein